MSSPHRLSPEVVAALSRAAGLELPAERLDAVADLLTPLFEMQARIDRLDLAAYAPEMTWDARWPDQRDGTEGA